VDYKKREGQAKTEIGKAKKREKEVQTKLTKAIKQMLNKVFTPSEIATDLEITEEELRKFMQRKNMYVYFFKHLIFNPKTCF